MSDITAGVEEEAKFTLDGDLPELSDPRRGLTAVARTPVVLRSAYHDTADHRLARAGVSLRHRTGSGAGAWQLKVPVRPGDTSKRRELSVTGARAAAPPERLTELVLAWTRREPLVPVATLRTHRATWSLVDADGTEVAEIVDDRVEHVVGRKVVQAFREVEVERRGIAKGDLDRLYKRLESAGAQRSGGTKLAQVLGAEATPWVAPALKKNSTVADLLARILGSATADLVAADVAVRLGEDDGIHQLRVACRRLRTGLRGFAPYLDDVWSAAVSAELSWLASALGAARDAEVVTERVTASVLDLGDAGQPLLGDLAVRKATTAAAVTTTLTSARYLLVVQRLLTEAVSPPTTSAAAQPAREAVPPVVDTAWEKVERAVRKARRRDADDAAWHAVRIAAKRARYVAEAATPVLGDKARRVAKRSVAIQDVLGAHRDALLAADEVLALAVERAGDGAYGVVAGRVAEREWAAARASRAAFAKAWRG